MVDAWMYISLGIMTILLIGMIIMFVMMTNINSTLKKQIDELTTSSKTDLFNTTNELRRKTTIFDHPEFDALDPKLRELLKTNLSYGFIPNFMTAISSYITRQNLMGVITDKLTALNAMSKDDILALMISVTPQPTTRVETYVNYFKQFFR
jgi:hypothetical protein